MVATFSILADLVKNVGGDRVEIASLVPVNGDAHVYAPSPADAKKLADAKVVFTNGLGFEGWIPRLVKASGTKAAVIVATKGIKPRKIGREGRMATVMTPMPIRMPGNRSRMRKSMSPISATRWSRPIRPARRRMRPMPRPIPASSMRSTPK